MTLEPHVASPSARPSLEVASLLRRALPILLLVAATLVSTVAHARVVERVVAVVGEKPILLSELRRRATPELTLVAARTSGDTAQIAVAEPQIFKSTLDQLIDERLMEQQADRAHITVSLGQIDEAIRNKASALGLSTKDLLAIAVRQGFSEQDYRDEVRRQLLEGRLIQLRVAGRVTITETDARATYGHLARQLEDEPQVELQVLALRVAQSPGSADAKNLLASEIIRRGASGEDFCDLVRQFSDDVSTRDTCGDPGAQLLRNIQPDARRQLTTMNDGDISLPTRLGEAIVVFRLKRRVVLPPFEQIKEQMYEQATEQAVLRQRDLWVQELRRGVYLDIRL